MKKYLLEVGFSIHWPSWGEDNCRMFRAYIPVYPDSEYRPLHSYEFISSCYVVVDLTNKKIIKDRIGLNPTNADVADNVYWGYKLVPVCDVDDVMKQRAEACNGTTK